MFDVGCDNFLKTKHDLEEEIEEYLKTLEFLEDIEFEVSVLETDDTVSFWLTLLEMFSELEKGQIEEVAEYTSSKYFGENYQNECPSYFFKLER